jgi:hypothetical protein
MEANAEDFIIDEAWGKYNCADGLGAIHADDRMP